MSEIDWSKAPAGTTHWQPSINGWQPGWIMAVEDKVFFRHEKWLIDDATLDEAAIPRPSKPQWSGPEDGLPPVGTVCEVKPAQGAGWCSGTVVHVTAKGVALYEDRWGDFGYSMAPADFRPLKSDKERAVEAAMKVMPYPGSPSTRADLACAYDAGFLRLPEERS